MSIYGACLTQRCTQSNHCNDGTIVMTCRHMRRHRTVLLTFIDPWCFHSRLQAVNPGHSFSYITGLTRSTSSPPLVYLLNQALTDTHTCIVPQFTVTQGQSLEGLYYLPIIIMSCWWSRSISLCVDVHLLSLLCTPFFPLFCFHPLPSVSAELVCVVCVIRKKQERHLNWSFCALAPVAKSNVW